MAPTARAVSNAATMASIPTSSWARTTVARASSGPWTVMLAGRECGVGAGHHDDRVLAGVADADQRPTGRPVATRDAPRRRCLVDEHVAHELGGGVASDAFRRTRPTAPARAAATAWLSPLPPGASKKSVPSTVSPGPGKRGARADQIDIGAADDGDEAHGAILARSSWPRSGDQRMMVEQGRDVELVERRQVRPGRPGVGTGCTDRGGRTWRPRGSRS